MNETYVLAAIGVVLSVIGFLSVQLLNGIRADIAEIKSYLFKIEGDLHQRVNEVDRRHSDSISDMDRRVTKVEARCAVVHSGKSEQ